ncbi:unnamed protein product, partial [Heterosigma akashiwo]
RARGRHGAAPPRAVPRVPGPPRRRRRAADRHPALRDRADQGVRSDADGGGGVGGRGQRLHHGDGDSIQLCACGHPSG